MPKFDPSITPDPQFIRQSRAQLLYAYSQYFPPHPTVWLWLRPALLTLLLLLSLNLLVATITTAQPGDMFYPLKQIIPPPPAKIPPKPQSPKIPKTPPPVPPSPQSSPVTKPPENRFHKQTEQKPKGGEKNNDIKPQKGPASPDPSRSPSHRQSNSGQGKQKK